MAEKENMNESDFTGYNEHLKNNARMLRKNMTDEEKRLWFQFLRSYSVKWYRQRVVDRYIVDFYCSKAKLVVELDGSQHYNAESASADKERTERLEQYGLEVVRFSNDDVRRNFYEVCTSIDELVKARTEE